MSEFLDIAQEKRNQSASAIVNKENQIIKEALAKHFGNDDFEANARKCEICKDPKSGVRKIFHGGVVLCELHPMQVSDDGDYRQKVSFSYRMLD